MKWYHNVYSEEAEAEMQSEAERRVRAAQERQRLLASGMPVREAPPSIQRPQGPGARPGENRPLKPPGAGQRSPAPHQEQARRAAPSAFIPQSAQPLPELSALIGSLGGDRLMLLALLWLLWNENADKRLLLALMYLLL